MPTVDAIINSLESPKARPKRRKGVQSWGAGFPIASKEQRLEEMDVATRDIQVRKARREPGTSPAASQIPIRPRVRSSSFPNNLLRKLNGVKEEKEVEEKEEPRHLEEPTNKKMEEKLQEYTRVENAPLLSSANETLTRPVLIPRGTPKDSSSKLAASLLPECRSASKIPPSPYLRSSLAREQSWVCRNDTPTPASCFNDLPKPTPCTPTTPEVQSPFQRQLQEISQRSCDLEEYLANRERSKSIRRMPVFENVRQDYDSQMGLDVEFNELYTREELIKKYREKEDEEWEERKKINRKKRVELRKWLREGKVGIISV